jgi:hypothetical protein
MLTLLHPSKQSSQAGLPDGIFSNQKSQFGYILKGLAFEDAVVFGQFSVNLVCFT